MAALRSSLLFGLALAQPAFPQRALRIAGSDAGYLDPGACAPCHSSIAATYARTSMAQSFGRMPPGAAFPEGAFQQESSGEVFTAYRRDGAAFLSRHLTDPDGSPSNVLERKVDFWFGSGNHARGYLHQSPTGKLIELPVTWYASSGWRMSPGFHRPDHAGFSRKVTYGCLFCRTSYPEIEPGSDDWEGAWKLPGKLPQAIDCQRCHGPGRAPVEAANSAAPPARVRSSILNPARLPPARQTEVCLQCHLETTSLRLPSFLLRHGRGVFSYRPGEPLEDYILHFDHAPGTGHDNKFEFVSSAYRLRQSACFLKSASMTCTTCHDPHDSPRGPAAVARYADACLGCHGPAIAAGVSQNRHPASRECAACHMPKRRPSDAIHVRVADHLILARPSPDAGAPLIEHNDANTPPYRGNVVLYYPPVLPQTPETELYLAVAQVKHQSNLKAGLAALQALVTKHQTGSWEFYFELAEAWRQSGNLAKAIEYHRQACRRAPANWRAFHALGLTLSRAGRPAEALEALARAASLAPGEAVVHQGMGEILSREGKTREAVAAFRGALAADPEFAEAHNNLGTALLRLGDHAEAEKALRVAMLLRPEMAAIRVNLASLLARAGKLSEAWWHFKGALRVNSSFAEGHSAFATALAAAGQTVKARAHYEAAFRFNPELPVTPHNLGAVLQSLGEDDGAIRAFRQAVRYAPEYFEAHGKLGALLLARGERAAAELHLRKAASGPDGRIKAEANRLLRQLP